MMMTRPTKRLLEPSFALLVIAACAVGEDGGEQAAPPRLPPPDCMLACAADGHAVVNCRGEVVTACSAYSSCFDAECVPGCEAAERAQSSVGCEYYAAKPSAE